MRDDRKLSYGQLHALCGHLQELLEAVTAANNGLATRLHGSPTFRDADRATLNAWSIAINDIHAMSDARVMEIRSRAAPRGVQ